MNNDDEQFDAVLREHFSRSLDPQLGKARAAVARETAKPRGFRRLQIMWLAIAGATAAMVIIAVIRRPVSSQDQPLARIDQISDLVPIEYEIAWRAVDEGTAMDADDMPMRAYRRQAVQTIRWTDPQTSAKCEYIIPADELVLTTIKTY